MRYFLLLLFVIACTPEWRPPQRVCASWVLTPHFEPDPEYEGMTRRVVDAECERWATMTP